MNTYRVYFSRHQSGFIELTAETAEQAVDKALDLPTTAIQLDDSGHSDWEVHPENTEEDFDTEVISVYDS